MNMSPLMNAITRKCKTHGFVCGVRSASMGIAHGYRDMRTQKNIRVYLRTEAVGITYEYESANER